MKKVLAVIGIVLVLGVLAVIWVFSSLDDIVKKQIEVVGSELTGTKVSVGGVGIKLTEGSGRITGLTVGNPGGYKTDHAFSMNLLQLGIDLQSVGKNPLILNELIIDAPQVTMEMNEKGNSNLKDISDNLSANSADAEKATEKPQESGAESMRILIRKLVVKDLGYKVSTPVKELGDVDGTLPTVTLSDVGGSKGATPAEIGKLVIGDLSKRVIKRSAEAGVKSAVENKVKDAVGGIGDALKGLGK